MGYTQGMSNQATEKGETDAKTETVVYDVAEQLRSPEEMAAYLDAWFEEAPDDAEGIGRALGHIARAAHFEVAHETD
jgi:DNA-binding phage protein